MAFQACKPWRVLVAYDPILSTQPRLLRASSAALRMQACVAKHAYYLQILGASAVAAGVALAAFPAADGASVFTEVEMCSVLSCPPSVVPAIPHQMHLLAMQATQDQGPLAIPHACQRVTLHPILLMMAACMASVITTFKTTAPRHEAPY